MRSVVTGGFGFIGSHLVQALLDRGDHVTVVDNLSTGRAENLADVLLEDRLRLLQGSVLDRPLLDEAISGAHRVFHLAAAVGVRLIVDHPLDGLRTNIHGTENVLDACLAEGARLLVTSTSEIYGKNTADRLQEDSDRVLGSPLVSRWTYAAAKGVDEAFTHAYWRELGLEATIVRPFNTVGPRQTGRYGMVFPTLVAQALHGEPLTVYGDGRQTRCFSYVGDIVPAMIRLIEEPASYGRAFNLGGEREISILELAERILEITESTSRIEFVSYDRAYGEGYEDMRRRVPDNSRAKGLVGFDPSTTLDEMIVRIADHVTRREREAASGRGSSRAGV